MDNKSLLYDMAGGGKCSLCGSEGTNKSTCPLNPIAVSEKRVNPEKHPKAIPKGFVGKRRSLIGEPADMYTYAGEILEAPPVIDPKTGKYIVQGRRFRARSAISELATDVKQKSGLCKDLESTMYKEELMGLAKDLELPVTSRTTKGEICQMLREYVEASMADIPKNVGEEEAEEKLLKASCKWKRKEYKAEDKDNDGKRYGYDFTTFTNPCTGTRITHNDQNIKVFSPDGNRTGFFSEYITEFVPRSLANRKPGDQEVNVEKYTDKRTLIRFPPTEVDENRSEHHLYENAPFVTSFVEWPYKGTGEELVEHINKATDALIDILNKAAVDEQYGPEYKLEYELK